MSIVFFNFIIVFIAVFYILTNIKVAFMKKWKQQRRYLSDGIPP